MIERGRYSIEGREGKHRAGKVGDRRTREGEEESRVGRRGGGRGKRRRK